MKPTVSVVIPFYNGSKWIERAIISVNQQSHPAIEFYVVNDGSTEVEANKLSELKARHNFTIINQENTGQGGARNTGANASRAEYICFLDQDDYFLPNHISDLVEAIPENDPNFGFVYGDFCHADADGKTINSGYLVYTQPNRHPKVGHIKDLLSHDLMITPSSTLIKKSVFDSVGGFDPQFRGYEDDDLFIRIFRNGYSNYFLPKTVYVWCMHGESTSWSIRMSKSRFLFFKKAIDFFPDDYFNKIFYFKDCLRPRFENVFLREAVQATLRNHPQKQEFLDILFEYIEILKANKNISKKQKSRLTRIKFMLTKLPKYLFPFSKTLRRLSRH